jgi:hypothetical protein
VKRPGGIATITSGDQSERPRRSMTKLLARAARFATAAARASLAFAETGTESSLDRSAVPARLSAVACTTVCKAANVPDRRNTVTAAGSVRSVPAQSSSLRLRRRPSNACSD